MRYAGGSYDGIDTRSTMNMDAAIRGIELSEKVLEETMKTILSSPVDDGVIIFTHVSDKTLLSLFYGGDNNGSDERISG